MRGPMADAARDVLLDSRARQRGITDPAAVAALLDAHRNGTADGGDALWSLLNLELWYRTFIDGEGVQTLSVPSSSGAGHHSDLLQATA
jgi:asparagine synthase (glutamine-hydrolysing)